MKTIKKLIDEITLASQETGVDVSPSDVGFIISLFFEGLKDGATNDRNFDSFLQTVADEAASVKDEG